MTNMSCDVYRGCKSGDPAKTFAAIFVCQPAEKIIQTSSQEQQLSTGH